jgi:hypothetical protein
VSAARAVTLILAAFALPAPAESLDVRGSCRDGHPQGAWQLVASDGTLRALGAFSRGRRTGSFIFWNASGVRVAHVPYEEDLKNGTLALWYERPVEGGEAPQRLEAVYASGRLDGVKRSWHPSGRLRGEYTYDRGVLVAANAWDGAGAAISADRARAQADADSGADEAYFAMLDRLVDSNLPPCERHVPERGR